MQHRPSGYRLDIVERQLVSGSEHIRLTATTCAMLAYLVRNRRRLIPRQELLDAVWPERYVSESRVKQVIQQLRVMLGDNARAPTHIENHHGLGYRYVGDVSLAGEEPPAPAPGLFRHDPPANPPSAGMLGRQAELEILGHAWRDAINGCRRTVFVTGDANIGKSLLISRFLAEQIDPPDTLVAATCYGGTDADTPVASPLLEVIEDLGRQTPSQGIAESLARLRRRLGAEVAEWEPNGPYSEPTPAGSERPTGLRLVPELARVVDRIARESAVVIWLDDAHWMDAASLDLLSRLGRRRGPARLLLLCSFRREEIAGSHHPLTRLSMDLVAHEQATELQLSTLDAQAVRAHLADTLPGLSAAMASDILEFSGGHPWFLGSIVEALAHQGSERWSDRQLNAGLHPLSPPLPVPDSARSLFDWLVEELSPEQQEVIETGAVIGEHFTTESVALATGIDPVEIEACLEAIARAGRLLHRERDGDGYRFRYRICRYAVAARVAPLRRQRIVQYAVMPAGSTATAVSGWDIPHPTGPRHPRVRRDAEPVARTRTGTTLDTKYGSGRARTGRGRRKG